MELWKIIGGFFFLSFHSPSTGAYETKEWDDLPEGLAVDSRNEAWKMKSMKVKKMRRWA